MEWTKEQENAIYKKNQNILVAAAAGSGKTAVLVERIINKIINEKIDIDKLLVVTFTNAAASEMRERILNAIYKKIEESQNEDEKDNLQKQTILLNKASICTIDSFCLDVIKNNFYEEDLSPNFRIGDNSEIELLKQEVLEELFEEKYENQDEEFQKLIRTYTSYRDDSDLKELILKIYTYIESSPFPEKWLEDKIEKFNIKEKEDFAKTEWGKLLLQEIEEELIDSIKTLEKEAKKLSVEPELEKYYQVLRKDIVELEMLLQSLDSWDKAYNKAWNLEFVTWPRSKVLSEEKERAKNIRDSIKTKIKKKIEKIFASNSEEANQDLIEMYKILLILKKVILEFKTKFSKKKKDKNLLDFSDIEHFALKILVKVDENGNIEKTEIAKKYEEKFKEIAIDEYQDSNLVQEYILTSISNGKNIFMVGDVKQSIYKFRQAMPELFLKKYKTYAENYEEGNGLKIKLFKNFRSRKNILEFTNEIFQNIMSEKLGDIEYTDEEYLNLGANYENPINDLKTEIAIINLQEAEDEKEEEEEEETEEETKEKEERIEDVELEAKFVAQKIKNMVDSNFQVYDNKKGEYRNLKYKDIVILLRSTKQSAPIYEKELIKLNIPVFSDTSQEYLDTIEIQIILSLLKIIDNPMQDIALVTVMRSCIGKFTDNDLLEIRLADRQDDFYTSMQKAKLSVNTELKEKIEKFLNHLSKWREQKDILSLDELIWTIYEDTGLYNYVSLMPNGALRQANLKSLFERAKQYESASFKGLFNFIKFIEKLHLSSGDLGAAKLIGENEDVVRIMSIHKSKGLEFPIVFLSGTGKQFNMMDLNKDILLHQDLGIGVKYIDYDLQIKYDTLSKQALKNQLFVETLAEEMRILYVALTRSKEKLIITGLVKDYTKEINKMQETVDLYKKKDGKINPIAIKKYKKYIEWILLVYLYNEERLKEISTLEVYKKEDIVKSLKTDESEEKIDVLKILEENIKDVKNEDVEDLKKILEYIYPYKNIVDIPTKTSVTKIVQKDLMPIEEDEMLEEEETEIEFPKPKFLAQEEEFITSAKKGTLMHLCMKNLDFSKDYEIQDIINLVQNLKQKEIITEKEQKSINVKQIFQFTKCPVWNELKCAKQVFKEKPFYINVKSGDVLGDSSNEDILVQGIIDLYFINQNDELVLLDYKTDSVKEADPLINKHKKQLLLYKKALEDALQRNVDKIYIYSFSLGKVLEL